MITPDRIRIWVPVLAAIACIGFGLLRDEMAWVPIGAGILGIPGFSALTKEPTPSAT